MYITGNAHIAVSDFSFGGIETSHCASWDAVVRLALRELCTDEILRIRDVDIPQTLVRIAEQANEQ